ncbi:Zinc finger, SWIM-type [Sesbania bispinosa]|nr:Zinc finger, SWIM-type [Sesbania bispinosa]
MYIQHTIDHEGRLQHLFWADGISQMNYMVYGDVLAFDATCGKNKYLLSLVVFSGVNNHNRSTIFVGVVVSNETEETYVWLLNQFVKAMKGNEPKAVITDGDNAMKNAIKRVFPNAHHRLCAWNLLCNETSNVGKPGFTAKLKKCMIGDYDLDEFRQMWDELSICDSGKRKTIWHLYMVTLCCGLYKNGYNDIFIVCKPRRGGKEWQVTYNPSNNDFKCVCMRMESWGLACEHIVVVLVHMSIDELPRCLVLKRWSKGAKDDVLYFNGDGNTTWDPLETLRGDDLMFIFGRLTALNKGNVDDYNDLKEKALQALDESEARNSCRTRDGSGSSRNGVEDIRDPIHMFRPSCSEEEKMLYL